MATKRSSGILLYRDRDGTTEFLLVHPGGPYWARKDEGAWSIPKGGIEEDEDSRTAALRELDEELGPGRPDLAQASTPYSCSQKMLFTVYFTGFALRLSGKLTPNPMIGTFTSISGFKGESG